MQLDVRAVASMVRRFWRWWTGELVALLPDPVRARMHRLVAVLEIETDGATLLVHHRFRDEERELARIALAGREPPAIAAELRAAVEGADGFYDRLRLRVAPSRVLRRRVRMPAAARHSLAEAIGYDIDRQTPFSEDQVYFAAAELPEKGSGDEILVRLDVVPRHDVDGALAALEAAGLVPDGVSTGGAEMALRVPAPPSRRRVRWRRVTAVLAVAAAVLFALASYLPVSRVQAELAQVEGEMRNARAAAARVESLRREMLSLADAENELFARKIREPMVLTLLAEVTAAIPDDAFLIEFGVDGREVTLSGYAAKASDAIAWIEGTEHLGGARFLSPVMQDQRLGRERFTMAAERASLPAGTGSGEKGAQR